MGSHTFCAEASDELSATALFVPAPTLWGPVEAGKPSSEIRPLLCSYGGRLHFEGRSAIGNKIITGL